ncbi:hypothetical protein [Streptomyces enissocaesilis]|uniref:Secreted protein n=1 Tax=Streptomyces enissocaesilis TaxID=332589 RepID=A0ABP6JW27_9ACTN
MQLRHVRAVAVFGVAVFALTGARGSGGGGCDNSSSSSSSSDGSSYDDDYSTSGGSSTSGSSTTGSTTSGSGSSSGGSRAVRDVRIDSCQYDVSRGIVAAVSATNSSSSRNYTYTFTVSFTDPGGTSLGDRATTMPMVLAGATDRLDVATPYVPKEGETSGGRCTLTDVKRVVS